VGSKGIDCAPCSGNRWQNVDIDKGIPFDKEIKRKTAKKEMGLFVMPMTST